jgi:hypothetical protein
MSSQQRVRARLAGQPPIVHEMVASQLQQQVRVHHLSMRMEKMQETMRANKVVTALSSQTLSCANASQPLGEEAVRVSAQSFDLPGLLRRNRQEREILEKVALEKEKLAAFSASLLEDGAVEGLFRAWQVVRKPHSGLGTQRTRRREKEEIAVLEELIFGSEEKICDENSFMRKMRQMFPAEQVPNDLKSYWCKLIGQYTLQHIDGVQQREISRVFRDKGGGKLLTISRLKMLERLMENWQGYRLLRQEIYCSYGDMEVEHVNVDEVGFCPRYGKQGGVWIANPLVHPAPVAEDGFAEDRPIIQERDMSYKMTAIMVVCDNVVGVPGILPSIILPHTRFGSPLEGARMHAETRRRFESAQDICDGFAHVVRSLPGDKDRLTGKQFKGERPGFASQRTFREFFQQLVFAKEQRERALGFQFATMVQLDASPLHHFSDVEKQILRMNRIFIQDLAGLTTPFANVIDAGSPARSWKNFLRNHGGSVLEDRECFRALERAQQGHSNRRAFERLGFWWEPETGETPELCSQIRNLWRNVQSLHPEGLRELVGRFLSPAVDLRRAPNRRVLEEAATGDD